MLPGAFCLLKILQSCSIIVQRQVCEWSDAGRRKAYERKKHTPDLKESRYTVVLSGIEMMQESGYPLLRDGEESYDIESKYGYSFEEMFSSSFYSARKELFFRFYKEVILRAARCRRDKVFSV